MQVFAKGVDKDMVVLMAARASRLENQDAIDCAIVSMLADPKEVRVQRSLASFMIDNTEAFCYLLFVVNSIMFINLVDDSLISILY